GRRRVLAGARDAVVGGARLAVVAIGVDRAARRIDDVRALVTRAGVRRARVAVVAVRHRVAAVGHGAVHAAERRIAAVGGARIAVVTVERRPGLADAVLAGLAPVADVRVGARGAVRPLEVLADAG